MLTSRNCSHCKNDFPISMQRCSHCGLPGLFPNVDVALSEQNYLQDRYNIAENDALSRGIIANVDNFEKALDKSNAVMNRSLSELLRLAESENEIYATYHQLSESVKMQSGEIWDSRRQSADSIFFTGYHKEIRFAALSLYSIGILHYGECALIFRENMISHRASVFEENTTTYYMRNNIKDAADVPKGYRAIWTDRTKLCVAKLASKIDMTTTPAQYSNILIQQRTTPDGEDEFVEVHIFGSMTFRTFEEVNFKPVSTTISKTQQKMKRAMIEGVKEMLVNNGVKVN